MDAIADSLSVAGLLLVGAGTWLIWPPASLIVVGALLIVASARLAGPRQAVRRPADGGKAWG